MGRNLISFDRDIVDEVVRRSDGKFTKQQVEWCMKASVSYVHHLARYTDNISIRIPFIGYVICNLREKIKAIEDMEGLKNGDPLIRDNHEAMYQCRYGMTWEQLQDFQQKQFKK